MFEGLILSELSKEDLHRPLRAKEVFGILLFMASFGLVGAVMAIPIQWLRLVAALLVLSVLPFYVKWMVRVFRASGKKANDKPPRSPPTGSDHAA
jgi:hypothetical protein